MLLLIIKFCLVSFLLFAIYKVTFGRTVGAFVSKRIVLLSLLPLSIWIVYLSDRITDAFTYIQHHSGVVIPKLMMEPVIISEVEDGVLSGVDLLTLVWGIGALAFAMIFFIRILSLCRLIFTIKGWESYQNNLVAYSDKEQAFSFWKWVHIPKKHKDNRAILLHEMAHNQSKHSIDTLLIEVMKVVAWFNPMVYLIDKELKLVHEFEVDHIVQEKVGQSTYIDSLLNVHFGTSSIQFIQLFNNKKMLKMRIKNLSKTAHAKRTGLNWAVALVGVTLITVSSAFISNENTANYQPSQVTKTEGVVGDVDKQPEFKGGMDALIAYMVEEVVYPKAAKNNNTQGTVHVSFVVTEKGEITDVKLKKGVETSLDEEALRVVREMPNWIPGEKDGKKVSVEMTLPIAFKL